MTDTFKSDELLLKTKRLRLTYSQHGEMTAIRFIGIVTAEDWRALRPLFSHINSLSGTCILDMTDVLLFDSTLYSLLVWVRLARQIKKSRFALVAGETTRRRLTTTGIGKWLPIVGTLLEARKELSTPPPETA